MNLANQRQAEGQGGYNRLIILLNTVHYKLCSNLVFPAIAKNASNTGQKKSKPAVNNNVIGLNAAPSQV